MHRFVVLGSTANHYYVRLRDEKHVCDCIDHKSRRHDCKHIRLILTSLGLGRTANTSPNSSWRTVRVSFFVVVQVLCSCQRLMSATLGFSYVGTEFLISVTGKDEMQPT